jgi:putative ABC transport system permease protein
MAMRFAVAQLSRTPVRTALLVLTVAALIFAVEFLGTLSRTLQAYNTGALAHDRADAFVYAADAQGSIDASRLPPRAAAAAARVPGVASVADLGVADFTVTADARTFELALIGVGTVTGTGWPAVAVGGSLPGPGKGLADATETGAGLGVGRSITLRPGGTSLRIAGLASGVRYDGVVTVWTTLATWSRAVAAADPGGPIANALAIRVRPGVSASALVRHLDAALPGTAAYTRSSAVAAVPGAAVIAATFDLLIGVCFAVTVLVVGSVFLLSTIQRQRQWTTLRALGASTARLSLDLLIQIAAVVVSASALATGALLAVGTASTATFAVRAAPSLIAFTVVAVLIGAFAGAVLPVRRIAALDPAAALGRA